MPPLRGKRDLLTWQKKPADMAKETRTCFEVLTKASSTLCAVLADVSWFSLGFSLGFRV
jgi:hypothetical protein